MNRYFGQKARNKEIMKQRCVSWRSERSEIIGQQGHKSYQISIFNSINFKTLKQITKIPIHHSCIVIIFGHFLQQSSVLMFSRFVTTR